MTATASTKGQLTGRKVTAIFVVFFGIVMAVNFTMAHFASSTFGGVVVENSYVASQNYNKWLDEAAAEKKLGWSAAATRLPDNRVALRFTGAPDDLVVTGVARHPLGHAPDQALRFAQAADGSLVSDKAVAPGRWLIRLTAQAGQTKWREEQELR
jgi:nitrogen fixation protein FixH